MIAQAIVEHGILDTISGAFNVVRYSLESAIRSASPFQLAVAAVVVFVLWRILRR